MTPLFQFFESINTKSQKYKKILYVVIGSDNLIYENTLTLIRYLSNDIRE